MKTDMILLAHQISGIETDGQIAAEVNAIACMEVAIDKAIIERKRLIRKIQKESNAEYEVPGYMKFYPAKDDSQP